MADNNGLNLTIFKHLVDAFPFEGLIHVLPAPPGVQEDLVMAPIQGFHVDQSATACGILGIPGDDLLFSFGQ